MHTRASFASSRHTAARGGALRSLPVHRLHHPCGARAARRSKSEHIGSRRSTAERGGGAYSCIVSIYALASAGDDVFFLSAKGFHKLSGGALIPIGREKVDRTFFTTFDASQPQFALAAHDPKSGRIFWTWNSLTNTGASFDQVLIYDPFLDRWAPAAFYGQFILSLANPGTTLEGLDLIAPSQQTITNAADNGSGAIRITVGSTAQFSANQWIVISGVVGVAAANGTWMVTIIDGFTLDLQGSTFSGTYTSGGIILGGIDALPFSLDDIAAANTPLFSADMIRSYLIYSTLIYYRR